MTRASSFENMAERIQELAREVGPNRKLPTVRELCRRFNTTPVTLDRALHAVERKGLVRREQSVGIFVTPYIDCQTLGIVFGQDLFHGQGSQYWGLLLHELNEAGSAAGHRMRVYIENPGRHLDWHREPLHADLAAGALNGLLVANVFNIREIDEMRGFGVPLVYHTIVTVHGVQSGL